MPVAARSLALIAVIGAALAACSSSTNRYIPPSTASTGGSSGGTAESEPPRYQVSAFKVGDTYRVAGQSFTPEADWSYDEVGIASWYGSDFNGRKTASGEVFDKNLLTAAHTTLPLPVIARVTNLQNGRSVKVRINDRGPFAHGRLIDVSQAAARKLGFLGNGTAKVRVQVLADESQALLAGSQPYQPQEVQLLAAVPVREDSAVYLQVGSFTERENADALKSKLDDYGEMHVLRVDVSGKRFYRVRMGPFIDAKAALNARERLARAGFFQSQLVVEGKS